MGMYSPNGVLRRQHYDILNAYEGWQLRTVYGYYWLQEPRDSKQPSSKRGMLFEEAVYLDFGQAKGLVVSTHPKYAAIVVGQYSRAQLRHWGDGLGEEWHFVSEGIGMQDNWRELIGQPLTGYQVIREFGRDAGLFLEFGGPSVLVSGFRHQLGVQGYVF